MKPSQIITLIVSLTVICTGTLFLLRGSSKASKINPVRAPKVEFKWGEGSEAGVPSAITQK